LIDKQIILIVRSGEQVKKIISGKVRDVYEISDRELIIVTTDRVSAFDVILPTEIPGKGEVLNKISSYWFEKTKEIIPNHILSVNQADFPEYFQKEEYLHRTVLVKKLKMLPFEFVVRGYMFGNMWNAYLSDRAFCGYELKEEYELAEKLKRPLFTPSTKSSEGHDEYITVKALEDALGSVRTRELTEVSLALYEQCSAHAMKNGIIIADTKFEFGLDENGKLVLADEVCTPDSSRFWSAEHYKVGVSPKSYDKQVLRDWLKENKLDGVEPGPVLPPEVVDTTARIYQECLQKLVH
jgi:phosphoribosylaminoimidazole-succinocarboxamide synthase